MKKTYIMFYLFIFPVFYLLAQNPKEFFPMQIGNYWAYWEKENHVLDKARYIDKIIGDTTFSNGKKYFVFKRDYYEKDTSHLLFSHLEFYRINDTGNVYRYLNNLSCEVVYYIFSKSKNQYWRTWVQNSECDSSYILYGIVTDTGFMGLRRKKDILVNRDFTPRPIWEYYVRYSFVEGIGPYEKNWHGYMYWDLEKAVINGKIIVDNFKVNVPQNLTKNKIEYNLYQNYPNPFNPNTTIRYNIGTFSNATVRLIIYDILGREIKCMINDIKRQGEYEETWDGKNKWGEMVSSGIYFYRLEVIPSNSDPPFISEKRMIYLK